MISIDSTKVLVLSIPSMLQVREARYMVIQSRLVCSKKDGFEEELLWSGVSGSVGLIGWWIGALVW